jgi:hypothetical protein
MTSRRNDVALAHQDTCEWLFKTPSFRSWKNRSDLQSNNGILWIKGHPGVGKSTLMKHLLRYCEAKFKGHDIAFYFFNARGGLLEKSLLGMLRSLMIQLLEQDSFLQERFIPLFPSKRSRHGESDWSWDTAELKAFLLQEYKRFKRQDTLFLIDGLDECNHSEAQEIVDFLEDLSENAIQSESSLRICLSSRHYPHIDMKKKVELVVEQQAEHDQDIFKYVQSKLKTTNKDIQKRILEKAQHIFIWVVLVVELLNREFNKGNIKAMWKKLNETPSDLDELFSKLLEKEDSEDDRKTAILLFQWVLFSVRPLKPTELYFAVLAGTDPDELGAWDRSQVEFETIKRFSTSASRGLVDIDSENENGRGGDKVIVQFTQRSVVDFLTRNQRLIMLDPTLAPNAVGSSHARLASCCMAYLMQEELRSLAVDISAGNSSSAGNILDRVRESYPFLEYSSKYLLPHADRAQAEGIFQYSLLERFQKHRDYKILQPLYDIFATPDESFKAAQPLYLVSLQGCYHLVRALLESGADTNAQGGYYGTALQAAATRGYTDIVTLLEEYGAIANATREGYDGRVQVAAAPEEANQDPCKEAEALDVQAMEIRDQVLDPEHTDTLSSMDRNANTLFARTTAGTHSTDQREQGTDSGYQSGTYGKLLETHSALGEGLEVIPYTHEDSVLVGYLPGPVAETEYAPSETPSLPRPQDENYITDLAAELFSIIVKSCGLDRRTFKRISEMLPGLLRSFALKVGYRAQTPIQRDVYYFVHKSRM